MDQAGTVELLREVYKNAKTGKDAIEALIQKSDSVAFSEALQRQRQVYHNLADAALLQLRTFRELPADSGVFSKLEMWTGVQMRMMTNKSTHHMAEILIDGSTAGVNDLSRLVNANPGLDRSAVELAKKLMDAEQEHINLMRRFL